ncbi:sulfite exporter TauE/SafE family protein [Candidatus Bathyarchaeota archaeon]|nr:sulfite exporter TauE/SafE family protein [Candidatus Bathyarchaeota archaeon]MBT4319177.1 sulfite exporter TauE/SafE family protein [Candidatus Bathyarchaeota archaeon]MBT4422819.1 sulfite exporter TauE/SafE family protein [Candidatus Bathyarchaeota archaeon]MBT5641515.1 sulfite exporter TauE/SafE family protein [Candidatus Bathyarchaeota archaeon]MBT6605195.1 sulfite exporter TauE/SafE family protein [Candidatus Bathyarchaeota archaeon]
MTPLFTLYALIIALGSGFLGALLGLGGGVIMVPLLIVLLDIPIHIAAGASIIAVVATSSAATSVYVKNEITNTRLGMFLELATTVGALTGAFLMSLVSESFLQILLGASLVYAATVMFNKMRSPDNSWTNKPNDWLAERLHLGGSYWDDAIGAQVEYGVHRTLPTFFISYIAGIISGLLGIGGGGIKVPAMNVISNIPMKVSVATSNFMIGVTASASALVYLRHGYCDFFITAPVVLGTLIGSSLGAKATKQIQGVSLKRLFVLVLLILGLRMVLMGASLL